MLAPSEEPSSARSRAISGESKGSLISASGQSNCASNRGVRGGSPHHHRTRRRAFVEPGRDLVSTHRKLGLVYSAPIGGVVAATPQQVREKEAVLLRVAHPERPLLPIQAARSDCIVIVEEATFARQREQRGVGHLRPAADVADVDRPTGEIWVWGESEHVGGERQITAGNPDDL